MKNKITTTLQERKEIRELHGSNPAPLRGVSFDAGTLNLWVLEDREITKGMKTMLEAEKKILPTLPKIEGVIIFGTTDKNYEQLGEQPYGFIPILNEWEVKLNKKKNGRE